MGDPDFVLAADSLIPNLSLQRLRSLELRRGGDDSIDVDPCSIEVAVLEPATRSLRHARERLLAQLFRPAFAGHDRFRHQAQRDLELPLGQGALGTCKDKEAIEHPVLGA